MISLEAPHADEATFLSICRSLWQYRGVPSSHKLIQAILNTQTCRWCNARFTPTDARTEYCSQSCGQMGRRQLGAKGEA